MATIQRTRSSGHNFTSLLALTLAVLVLCQLFGTTLGASGGIKNKYAAMASGSVITNARMSGLSAVIIGTQDSCLAAEEAFGYLRIDCVRADTVDASAKTDMLVLSGAALEDEAILSAAEGVAARGGTVIVSGLPGADALNENSRLRGFLGVKKVIDAQKDVFGARLFDGFLLGGEQNYYEIIKKIVSVSLLAGYKIYMTGMDEEKNVIADAPVIWRYRPSVGGFVFVVNADFLEKRACAGLVTAMYCQTRSCTVYPVLNSQLLVVVGAPYCSVENGENVRARYAMDSDAFLRNTLFAYLLSTANTLGWKLTWAYTVALGDEYTESDITQMDEYLRQIIRNDGELALWGRSGELLARDREYFTFGNYSISSVIAEDAGHAAGMGTALVRKGGDQAPLTHTEDCVLLYETHDAASMDDMDDLALRCSETALAYSAASIEIERTIYAEDEGDDWVKMGDTIGKNLYAHWHPFQLMERVTLSEAGYRARRLLALEYDVSYLQNEVIIKVVEPGEEEWFLLRCENSYIRHIEGGEYKRLESDAYLIRASEETVVITLNKWHYMKFY